MTEATREKRKRAESPDEQMSEKPEQKKIQRARRAYNAASLGLTEDEALDAGNDRTYEDRKAWLESQTSKRLGDICADNGLKKGGLKGELVTRILDHLNAKSTAPEPTTTPETSTPDADSLSVQGEKVPTPTHRFTAANKSDDNLASPLTPPTTSSATPTPSRKTKAKQRPVRPVPLTHAFSTVNIDGYGERVQSEGRNISDMSKIKRYYPSQEYSISEYIAACDRPEIHRFKGDLNDLAPEQIELCYCILANDIQALARRTTPYLELKDQKSLDQTERKETGFMAMDTLRQHVELMSSLSWHHSEMLSQREKLKLKDAHIKEMQDARVHDRDFFVKKIEKLSARLGLPAEVDPASARSSSSPEPSDAFDEERPHGLKPSIEQADQDMIDADNAGKEETTKPPVAEEAPKAASSTGEPAHPPEAATNSKKSVPEFLASNGIDLPGLGGLVPDSQDDEQLLAVARSSESPENDASSPPTQATVDGSSLKPIPSFARLTESPDATSDTTEVHPSNPVDSSGGSTLLRPMATPPAPTSTPALSEKSQEERPARGLDALEDYDDDEEVNELFEHTEKEGPTEKVTVTEEVVVDATMEDDEGDVSEAP